MTRRMAGVDVTPYRLTAARALMGRYDIRPVKSLGQNFLIDPNIVKKIAELPGLGPDDAVCEIGPGLGALTVELAARARRVVAVEKDARIIPALEEALGAGLMDGMRTPERAVRGGETSGAGQGEAPSPESVVVGNVEIVRADFLDYDLGRLPPGCKLVGNLPYRVTTPIIMKAVGSPDVPPLMVFMMQREVAVRICAPPGGRDYGAVSVAVQYRCRTEYAMDVSREVFTPKPNVDSAVVVMRSEPGRCGVPKDEKLFFAVVKAGFGQRRKMLRNALSSLVPDAGALDAAFTRAGVSGEARAETLSVSAFIALADAIGANRS
jgi:16S rRNA (adenine1518-N6/adenine1519-N6)-dimethyltransferase